MQMLVVQLSCLHEETHWNGTQVTIYQNKTCKTIFIWGVRGKLRYIHT